MKKKNFKLMKGISDKSLIDVAVQRGLLSKDEVQLRLIPDEELLKQLLKAEFEIAGGSVVIKANSDVINELTRRTWVRHGLLEVHVYDDLLPF